MPWSLSTYLFRHSSLGARTLDQIAAAGFEAIEIYGDRGHFDYTNPSQLREIAQWAAGSPVKFSALHAPLSSDSRGISPHSSVSIAFLERQRRQDSMDEIKRALELAEHAPVQFLILHLGLDGEEFDLRKFDAAMTSLEHLRLFAHQRGVQILIENISNELSTPRRLKEFFAHTHLRNMDVCLDAGHAHLEGSVVEAIEILGKSIAAVHLSDNNGNIDDHHFPPSGGIPWKDVFRSLAEHAPEALPTLEGRASVGEKPALEQARASREQLQKIMNER